MRAVSKLAAESRPLSAVKIAAAITVDFIICIPSMAGFLRRAELNVMADTFFVLRQ
jgi:hypothetical protein